MALTSMFGGQLARNTMVASRPMGGGYYGGSASGGQNWNTTPNAQPTQVAPVQGGGPSIGGTDSWNGGGNGQTASAPGTGYQSGSASASNIPGGGGTDLSGHSWGPGGGSLGASTGSPLPSRIPQSAMNAGGFQTANAPGTGYQSGSATSGNVPGGSGTNLFGGALTSVNSVLPNNGTAASTGNMQTPDIPFQNQARQTWMDSPQYNPNGANTWAIQNGQYGDLNASFGGGATPPPNGQVTSDPTQSPALKQMLGGGYHMGGGYRSLGPSGLFGNGPRVNAMGGTGPMSAQQRDTYSTNFMNQTMQQWSTMSPQQKSQLFRQPVFTNQLINNPQYAKYFGFNSPEEVKDAINSLYAGNVGGGMGFDQQSPLYRNWGG